MKFSVIVPIYNVEDYLEICIKSLLNQNYDNYEIILVDDGSTDNCGKICDKYAKNCNKIKVIHKENGGLSDARNSGIESSSGDFLIFVDSDDFIKKNTLKDISDKIDDSTEVLITRFVESFHDKDIERDYQMINNLDLNFNKIDYLNWILNESYNTWPAQKFIISRRFLFKHNLRFRKSFLHEDMEWTSFLCMYGSKFQFYYPIWYFHRMKREGSITNVIRPKRVTDVIIMAYDLIYGFNSNELNKLPKNEKRMIIGRLMKSVYPLLMSCRYMSREDINVVEKVLNRYRKILNNSSKLKHSLFALSIKIFGFKNMMNLFRILKFKE